MAMQILSEATGPLSAPELFDRLKASGVLTPEQLELTPDGKSPRFERDIYFGLIPEVNAGWVKRPKNAWVITDVGRDALARFPEPSAFQLEAKRLYEELKKAPEWQGRSSSRRRATSVDRESAADAQSVLESLYPDEVVREACLRRLGESARIADELKPGSWSITLFWDTIRLNVGKMAVVSLKRGTVSEFLSEMELAPDSRTALEELGEFDAYDGPGAPGCTWVSVSAEDLPVADDLLGDSHRRAIETAIERYPRTFYARAHSPGVTQLIRDELGIKLTDPPTGVSGRRGGPNYPPIEHALETFDRAAAMARGGDAERERQEVEAKFARTDWQSLPLESYALGTGNADAFCRVMEFGTPLLGSIRGGAALKHIIYRRTNGSWHFDPQYADVAAAWEAVRAAFIQAFDMAAAKDFASIDGLTPLRSGAALRTKALFVYFPEDLLPIFSSTHLAHFITLLDGSPGQREAVAANRYLRELMLGRPEFLGWSAYEMERFLYHWADPRQTQRVVKIAPGPGADQWDDCRDGGYICVGWDEAGDLSEYASKEEFEKQFADVFRDEHKGHKPTLTLKAREVWTLRELEPGDIVIANRGGSAVVGIGTVVEPGYTWRPDRSKYKHTVAVHWDDTSLHVLDPPVATWRTSTVAPVAPDLYQRIMGIASGSQNGASPPARLPVAPPATFLTIADDLDRRGQVVLHGPPGTGKTYTARRFSVWWLLNTNDAPEASWILGDEAELAAQERELSEIPGDSCAQLTRVTFHPSYSYEDFVEGFKPRPTEGRGGLELELRDGAFKAVCRAAADAPDTQYLMLIDEINRGNIPKIFGELITLLEKDKRGLSVRLPYSGEAFSVPQNVFIIGTMNTADRSIRLLDAALRRRFSFMEVAPEPELLAGAMVGNLPLDGFLLGLNDRIAHHVGAEKQIGHSFFLADDGSAITSVEEFFPRFTREVLPLLQEYAYEDMGMLESLLGRGLVDAERRSLRAETLSDPDALVDALSKEYGAGVNE
jgi:5-methylcytosine-specific restriction protein B